MDKTFYVTTPIYYVNDRPHIGHAYCTILADVLRRFHGLFGDETFFLTGVDEHGQKVEEAAGKRGMTPQEHCDDMQTHFRDLWPTLGVENDDFIRTTEERHTRVVQEALQRLWDKGEIYKDEYEGFYSPRVEKFFTEDELVDGKCPETGGEVHKLKEANYFFRMGKYKDALVSHIQDHPDFIRPESRRNEVLGFLTKQDLSDLCISRPRKRLSWGIEMPFDPEFVTYVWFDALLNYASTIGLYTDDERFRKWWPHSHHLIGKDILTTHSVYWTTMLMAMELPLPKHIIATGWWLVDQTKMSKSLGNVISPLDLKDKYGVDSLRYFLMREMVVGLDASFSEVAFLKRHNFDLGNDLGNLANRLAKLVQRSFEGQVPARGPEAGPDADLREQAEALPDKVAGLLGDLKVDAAIEEIMQLVRRVNRYVAETVPFKVINTDPERAAHTVYNALEALRFALNLLWPVMPDKTASLLEGIGAGQRVERMTDLVWGGLSEGAAVTLEGPPFPRFDMPKEFKTGDKAKAPKATPAEKTGGVIEFDQFAKLDLRVGTVKLAEPVEGSNKLLRVLVDLGETEPRQVVAGIANHYEPDGLVGKQVVVVANLQPRKVFGVESNGMIMAASDKEGLSVLTPARPVNSGSRVS